MKSTDRIISTSNANIVVHYQCGSVMEIRTIAIRAIEEQAETRLKNVRKRKEGAVP